MALILAGSILFEFLFLQMCRLKIVSSGVSSPPFFAKKLVRVHHSCQRHRLRFLGERSREPVPPWRQPWKLEHRSSPKWPMISHHLRVWYFSRNSFGAGEATWIDVALHFIARHTKCRCR